MSKYVYSNNLLFSRLTFLSWHFSHIWPKIYKYRLNLCKYPTLLISITERSGFSVFTTLRIFWANKIYPFPGFFGKSLSFLISYFSSKLSPLLLSSGKALLLCIANSLLLGCALLLLGSFKEDPSSCAEGAVLDVKNVAIIGPRARIPDAILSNASIIYVKFYRWKIPDTSFSREFILADPRKGISELAQYWARVWWQL